MNTGLFLIIVLLGLALLGIPICFSLGIATLGALYLGGLPVIMLPQKMFTGMDSVPLLAIPFFMLAGNFMAGCINQKILAVSNAFFGWVKGSLGVVTVVASSLFAAISGSGIATVSAIGGTTIPEMKKEGYPSDFAGAVASCSAILGPMIPPSIMLIVYGSATESSIAELFLASFLPGIVLAGLLVIYTLIYAGKKNFPSHERTTAKCKRETLISSVWALFMPVLILGGIFLGIFTATEAAAVSAIYAMLVGLFIYKDLKWKDLLEILSQSALTASTMMLLMAASKASSWVIVTSRLPDAILKFCTSITSSPIVILLMINILLFIVGMLMEGNAAIVMLTPLLLPLIKTLGIDVVHFGVIIVLNLSIGMVTPPVGVCLLLGNTLAEEKLERTLKQSLPFLAICTALLILVSYVPQISLWLPSIMK